MTTEEKYLNLFKISEGKYIIGIYQEGITVYKQQMRALNIFQALIKEEKLKPGKDYSVAVIGGGIAGLTFAAAALKSNISVTIFEKEATYLHMQSGCDTRKIHPNIYDWPDPGSTFPNARLPVLSWTHDTASGVVKQILKGLTDIKKEIEKSEHVEAPGLFSEHHNSRIASIEPPTEETQNKFTIIHGEFNVRSFCHLIIYAVGYGIEKKLDRSDAPSYWRNDALAQSILNNKRQFLVSGTGDGALIDLCRIKIQDFSYDRILSLLKSNPVKYNALIFKLLEIKQKSRLLNPVPADFYFKEFDKLPENYYKFFYDALEKDIVVKNHVIVQNEKPWEEALNFEKISMLNAFLTYLLKRKDHFEYWNGVLEFNDDEYFLDDIPIIGVEQFIIRHGTDKLPVTENMLLTTVEKSTLKALDPIQKKAGISANCWSFDSISKCFIAGSSDPAHSVMKYDKRSEYLTPDTKAVCLSQVMILSRSIKSIYKKDIDFRLALHRVTKFDEELFFQQITPYQGSKTATGSGSYQNVHHIEHGIVGEAIRTGKPLLIERIDEESFSRISKKLNLEKTHSGTYLPMSYLAIPILSPSGDKKKELATNIIFYMDAASNTFFDRIECFELIQASLSGLISYIESLIEQEVISMSEMEFPPVPIVSANLLDTLTYPGFFDLSVTPEKMYPNKTNLRFKEFYSFDIIYNK